MSKSPRFANCVSSGESNGWLKTLLKSTPTSSFVLSLNRKNFRSPKFHSPRSGPDERVSFRNVSVVENIGAGTRYREGSGIEEPIATYARVRIANKSGTETRTTKIADRIDKAAGDVARENRTAVVARPERRKASAALGKHVPRDLKATQHSVSPFRE
jgi:hypothetical protein